MPSERAPLLELNEATVLRGGKPVLDRLNLRLDLGEHVAILGPNGSGKSTLVRLITREDYPLARADGEPPVKVMGDERWEVFHLRRRMGIVSPTMDEVYVSGRLTAREAVVSGFFASRGLYDREATPEQWQAAAAALAMLEAERLSDRLCATLSTGELRRVSVARALVHDPESLLLDEPTAGLDMAAARHFLDRIDDLARAGKTIVMVTHAVDEVLPSIERVILMGEGRVAADGPKAEVLTGKRLSALYGVEVTVERQGDRYRAWVAG